MATPDLRNTLGGQIVGDIRDGVISLFTGQSGEPRPGTIGFVDGYGYRRISKDAQGNTVYSHLTDGERNSNRSYSGAAENAELDRRRTAKSEAKAEALGTRRFEAEQATTRETLKQQGLATEGQLTALKNQGAAQLQQLELLRTGQTNQLTDAREGRTHQTRQDDANRTLQRDQLSTENQRILEQMRLNDTTLNRKLTLENQQFERQAALDERNARRTKVLGALTIIAQSLQRV